LQNGTSVNTTTLHGQTPLHQSTTLPNIDIISLLIKYGAFLNAQDDEGDTPLHWAVREGRIDIATILLNNGISVNVANDDNETALHLAASLGEEQFVELLVKNNALIDEKDVEACTSLHLACSLIENEKLVKFLVDQGANVNAKDCCGRTPLCIATQNGQTNLASYLVSVGATNTKDKYGGKVQSLTFRKPQMKRKSETHQSNRSVDYLSNPFVQKASTFNRIHGGVAFSFIDV